MTIPKTKSPADLDAAVTCLREGGVVVLPTDTLYALVARARDARAVDRVFAIKGREPGKPLLLFVDSLEMADSIAFVTSDARRLISRFWPGALTLVFQKRPEFHSGALAGGDTVGMRVPDNEVVIEAVRALGEPITATSANLSGGPDPITADDVLRQLESRIDLIIDAGPCPLAAPSTIIDCTTDDMRILRHGAVPEAEIRAVLAEGS
jgi:L-threonylcarbamoyladenylate synthase